MAENSVFKSVPNFISRQVDHVISPEVRHDIYQKSSRFARDRPFTFALIVLGLVVIFSPILVAATICLFSAVCFGSLFACVTIIVFSPALLLVAVIAATIWLSYTTVRWSADLFAKVPIGSGNEGNRVLMRPEAEANGNQANAKLEVNVFKVEEKGDDGRKEEEPSTGQN